MRRIHVNDLKPLQNIRKIPDWIPIENLPKPVNMAALHVFVGGEIKDKVTDNSVSKM